MSYAADVHVAVYQVLDDVIGARVPPPGVKAEIHSIIDDLRSTSASSELTAIAEAISVRLHQLEWARARSDEARQLEARTQLNSIAAALLDFRIKN